MKLGSKNTKKHSTHPRFGREALKEPGTAENFKEYIREQLSEWEPDSDDLDTSWEYLHRNIVEALVYYCPPVEATPKRPWISSATLGLIEMRAEARIEQHVDKWQKLERAIRKSIRQGKRKWLENAIGTGCWEQF